MTTVTSPSGRKSGWTMLYNGNCPGPGELPFRFVDISAGLDTHMAIDNRGRLYTWGSSSWQYGGQTPVLIDSGPNYFRHEATYRHSDGYQAMVYPYQVGTKNNWMKCDHLEYIYVALDADGYLYAWGEDDTFGRGGWALASQYSGSGRPPSNPFIPGGEQAIVPQLINNVVWKDFAAGQYHMLGLKADGTLWIWGKNLDALTYGDAGYAEDYVSRTPIQVTWVPGPIKLISAHYSVNAVVTESNQIYTWGNWWNSHYPEAVPTLRPLSLPAGVSITDIKCSPSGIVVLLSNGQLYAQGDRIGFASPPTADSANFVLCPVSRIFVHIDVSETGAAAVDNAGNIWAWGNQAYLISNSTGNDIRDPTIPVITAAQNEGDGNWIKVGINNWSHMALDNQGRMFTWGSNVYGLLGIGEFQSAPTVDSYFPVECSPFATLDDGTPAIPGVLTHA
jgi:alpha-tubulin suppressor-like RCC1 family protein